VTGAVGERVRLLNGHRVDELLAVVLIVEMELEIWLRLPPHLWAERPLEAVAAVFYGAPVAVRRRRPAAALIACGLVLLVQAAAGGDLFDALVATLLPPVVLAFGVGAWLDLRLSLRALAAGFALFAAAMVLADLIVPAHRDSSLASDLPAIATLIFGAGLAGRLARGRARQAAGFRELAAISASLQAERAGAAVSEERIRISRELQDVIAGSVNSMVGLAGEAALLVRSDPEQARNTISTMEITGRQALADVRRLLGVLRKEDDSFPLAPQPDLNQVWALLVSLRARGLECELTHQGEPVDLLPGVSLVAYRVIESSVEIFAEHCRRSSVAVRFQGDWLELEIGTDTRIGIDLEARLAAIKQRVSLYDGSLGFTHLDGGSAIRARFPLAIAAPT
jgi:glucose-6-phosphate-specific signal transduction histidine kinase